jgi:hypothetical protein
MLNLLPNGVLSIPFFGEIVTISNEVIVSIDLYLLSDN